MISWFQRTGRRLLSVPSVTLILFVLIMVTMHSCLTFRMSKKEIDEYFEEHNIEGSREVYNVHGKQIQYVMAGNPSGRLILFVHGSPGSLSAFIHYLADTALTNRYRVISTDRIGFGHSSFGYGEASLEEQAELLKPILEKYGQDGRTLLVGHSLGGPVIARMAMDFPDLIGGLVLVAPSIDPKLEPNERWFRVPLSTPFLKWILPRSFRASNDEIVGLRAELEGMLPGWKDIRCPVIVIQGKKDQLVPHENAEFARKMLVNAPVEFMIKDDMNHFVPWSNPEMIQTAVLKLAGEN